MSGPAWKIDDADGDPELTGATSPFTVTLRTLGEALRRTWRRWVGAACLGALLGLGFLTQFPRPVTATATLLMVPANPQDALAMTTDMTLLQTRSVAGRVIAELELPESPESFLSTVTATSVSGQIMTVSVDAADDTESRERVSSLIAHFLEFRGDQLRSVSEGLVSGYEKRISTLQARVGELTREYERVSAEKVVNQVRLGDIVTERAALNSEVTELQRAIEDATLAVDAAVSASHVIDGPATTPFGARRQALLVMVSGSVLAAAATIGAIVLRSLATERLHRRRDVASALGVPVRVGVGAVAPRGLWGRVERAVTHGIAHLLRGRPGRWGEPLRRRDLEALVRGLATALPPQTGSVVQVGPVGPAGQGSDPHDPGRLSEPPTGNPLGPTTLGVAAFDRDAAAAAVLHTLARRLAGDGRRILLVDLSAAGAIVGRAKPGVTTHEVHGPGSLTLYRPEGDPALVSGPRGSGHHSALSRNDLAPLSEAWDQADVVLALVEVDPSLDLGILPTWVERLVPLISAGRASRELLSTVAALLTETGVDLPFALMEGADRSDRTFGHPAPSVDPRAADPEGEPAVDPRDERAAVRVVHRR